MELKVVCFTICLFRNLAKSLKNSTVFAFETRHVFVRTYLQRLQSEKFFSELQIAQKKIRDGQTVKK
jgi:uncharacterized protein with von Willebrand factor type A (vWA) domain